MLGNIKDKISEYLQLKFEIARLEVIERLVNVMGYVIFIVLALFLGFSFILFTGFGIAEWLGDLMGSRYGGYFSAGGILLIATLIVVWKSNVIVRFFANKFVALLTMKSNSEDSEEESEPSK